MGEQAIGTITHYFGKIQVAAIKLTAPLSVGDTIKIKTHAGEFTQKVDSMQIDKAPVAKAAAGQEVGMKIAQHAKEGDTVMKVL